MSVLIPTWNNLAFLQCCIASIRRHSELPLQIIVIVNEGTDGSLEWLREQGDIDVLHSPENAGVCYALNAARHLVQSDYILYLNDDMYVLPGWDTALWEAVKKQPDHYFYLSATMLEPHDTGNNCVHVFDAGDSPNSLREEALLQYHEKLNLEDWIGATWPPSLVSRQLWDLVGGMSPEFHPGMYSDPDFSMKLYRLGVRRFQGLGSSRVYHFGSKSTGRVRANKGRLRFLAKWGMSSRYFTQHFLQLGTPGNGAVPDRLPELQRPGWKNRLKLLGLLLKGQGFR